MSLNTSYTFTGNADWSLDGAEGSSNTGNRTIQVDVPLGSTVEQAFLYSTLFQQNANPAVNLNFDTQVAAVGNDDFVALGRNPGFTGLQAHRSDVTEFVSGIVGNGSNTPFEFNVSGMGGGVDGYTLAVVYSNPELPVRTIAFLDGFSASDGDDFRLSFVEPLTVDENFDALMSLGIGFGFQTSSSGGQFSTVDVNGHRLSSAAGGFDDGSQGNGGLVTIGGLGDDEANPADPNARPGPEGSRSDDELYNLAIGDFLNDGDTSILVNTTNPSSDDNIFFAGFRLDGVARVATAGNDAPVAANDSYDASTTGAVLLADVTANDFDPDGDAIILTQVNGVDVTAGDVITLPSGALLTYEGGDDFTYDPNGVFDDATAPADSFRYTITDGQASSSARVDINFPDEVPAILRIEDGSVLEGDNGITILSFDVTRSGNLANNLNIELDLLGITADSADLTDGRVQVLTTSMAPGDTSATVEVRVNGDLIPEFDELAFVSFRSVSTPDEIDFGNDASGIGTLTILDDDTALPPPPPPVEADIFGDPHLVSLDGLGYDFQAAGEFILVENTAGDDLTIQVRTEPINDAVSVITAMATEVDGNTVEINIGGDPALLINGTPTAMNALDGPVAVGAGQIFINGDGNEYTIVYPNGEQSKVGVFDTFMNVCVFLNEGRAGQVQGLLGNANGDTTDDLALRDGTVLPQPVDFDDLYGQYADSWRISEDEALFDRDEGETTADFQDPSFPRAIVTLDDLPATLVADAAAAVDALGIEDPILRDAAILDFALTGNSDFIRGAQQLAADPTVETAPANAPALGSAIGIRASTEEIEEGDDGEKTIFFEVYRIGDASDALTVNVAFETDTDDDDFGNVPDGDDGFVIDFAAGETSKRIEATVQGDTTVEEDEEILATLSTEDDDVSVISSSATLTILNDDEGLIGTEGDDILNGTPLEDDLQGLGGDDTINGFESDDLIDGGAGMDTIDAGLGDDLVLPGLDPDSVRLGGGNDVVAGTPEDLAGDIIQDFAIGEDIALVIGGIPDDAVLTRNLADSTVSWGGDLAPTTLVGDFTGAAAYSFEIFDSENLLFEDALPEDQVGLFGFADLFPELSEGVMLAADDRVQVNEVSSLLFQSGFNNVDGFEVTISEDSVAGFDNALGVVFFDVETEEFTGVEILSNNVKDDFDETFTITDLGPTEFFDFFIIQDGADFADGLGEGDVLGLGDNGLTVNGQDVAETLFFANLSDANADGENHAVSSFDDETGQMLIGFEDKTDLGDADFQDVVLTVDTFDFLV